MRPKIITARIMECLSCGEVFIFPEDYYSAAYHLIPKNTKHVISQEINGDNDIVCPNCLTDGYFDNVEEDWDDYYDNSVPEDDEKEICILCGKEFFLEEYENELGFCSKCINSPDFPYDLDAYFSDVEAGKVEFRNFDTMARGLLEPYRKKDK